MNKETNCNILWSNCLKVIQDNIPEAAFNTWFLPIVPLNYSDNIFTIQVPSQYYYEYLEDKYVDLLQQTLYREIGKGTILNYRILVETENNTTVVVRGENKPIAGDKNNWGKGSAKIPNPFERAEPVSFNSQINSKYNYVNFAFLMFTQISFQLHPIGCGLEA